MKKTRFLKTALELGCVKKDVVMSDQMLDDVALLGLAQDLPNEVVVTAMYPRPVVYSMRSIQVNQDGDVQEKLFERLDNVNPSELEDMEACFIELAGALACNDMEVNHDINTYDPNDANSYADQVTNHYFIAQAMGLLVCDDEYGDTVAVSVLIGKSFDLQKSRFISKKVTIAPGFGLIPTDPCLATAILEKAKGEILDSKFYTNHDEELKFIGAVKEEVKAKVSLSEDNDTTVKSTNLEESTMNYALESAKNSNFAAIKTATQIEIGRIVLDKTTKLLSPVVPAWGRGYIATPLGQIVLANALNETFKRVRPNDAKCQIVGEAVLVAAYEAGYKELDLSGKIDDLLAGLDLSNLMPGAADDKAKKK